VADGDGVFNPSSLVRNFNSEFGTLQKAILGGIGGVIAGFFIAFNAVVEAVSGILIEPADQLGVSIGGLVSGIVGGSARIIEQGVSTAVTSIAPGATFAIGPLTFLLSIVTFGGALYVTGQILALPFTSDTLPFTFTDIPFVGVDEEDE
jgi:hypothetical protein